MGYVWEYPGLWDGKGLSEIWAQWDMSGITPVSRDCGMGRTVGLNEIWIQWDMSGIIPVSQDCGMGRTVGLSET